MPRKESNFILWENYRQFFHNVSYYIKLNKFCIECGIYPSNLSNFIKYGTHSLTIDKLKFLYDIIIEFCENIA